MNRRDFLQLLLATYFSGIIQKSYANNSNIYNFEKYGDIRLLHITDTHAQLEPNYFREPNYNIGVGVNKNKPPHIVGNEFLKYYGIDNDIYKHAYTYLNFNILASKYGKIGGYAYLKTIIDQLREESNNNCLLLDGGDTWQGTGLSLLENGKDMVEASNLLGVDVMTGHWEFTYGEKIFLENISLFKGDFVAQNIMLNEEAIFNDIEPIDEDNHYQKPYTIKEINNVKIAIIGQAFPYTPIANPKRFIPNLTFGIKEKELQKLVNQIKNTEKTSLTVLLSHNGVDVDKKIAQNVSGLDIIFGGHTHDVLPKPLEIVNNTGRTLIINSGCNGKFISSLDLKIKNHSFDYKYRLIPIFSDLIKPSHTMNNLIIKKNNPHNLLLNKSIGRTNATLYRRSNFNGTFDNLLCDAMNTVLDTEISLSPGFRWGTTVLAGEQIRMKDIYNHTAITYPNTYTREMSGKLIKTILEDVADNLFNPDPYLQQGGDMVRTKGIKYTITPQASFNNRISNLELSNGKKIQPHKSYKVSGWASVNQEESGKPIWEITSKYIQNIKNYDINTSFTPKIKSEDNNIGIET